MIVIFYGTSAELIKLLGVVKGIDRSQQYLICTAQQKSQIEQFHEQSGIVPNLYLARGWRNRDVLTIFEMTGFLIKTNINFIRKYRTIRTAYKASDKKQGTRTLAVVHGDTLTTVMGAYFGRLLRLRVAHIEAGMRSGNIFNPFPEELDRRIIAKIARLHFSPNTQAVNNLEQEKTRGEIINTHFNTAKDAVDLAEDFPSDIVAELKLPKEFGLISIHRTELLERKKELTEFLQIISEHVSEKTPMVFVDHATTKDKITNLGLDGYLDKPGMIRIPKMAYMDFVKIIKASSYILTDSGGLQQDAYFLGVPTLIHRLVTETNEGIGANIKLSYLKSTAVEEFLAANDKQTQKVKFSRDDSPSKIIIDTLKKENYIKL